MVGCGFVSDFRDSKMPVGFIARSLCVQLHFAAALLHQSQTSLKHPGSTGKTTWTLHCHANYIQYCIDVSNDVLKKYAPERRKTEKKK